MSGLDAAPSNQTGSPQGEPVFLAVGKLRRAHGLRGDILMEVLTDFPERLRPGLTLYLGPQRQPHKLLRVRQMNSEIALRFDGFTNPEAVGVLRNLMAYVRADELPDLPAGEYYQHQLLGMQVQTLAGRALGRVEQVLETGANDVLAVRMPDGQELLLPAIDDVLRQVDVAAGLIYVELLPGLLPEEADQERDDQA